MAHAVRRGAFSAPLFNRYFSVNCMARGTSLFPCMHSRLWFPKETAVFGYKQHRCFSVGTMDTRCRVVLERLCKSNISQVGGGIYTKETAQTGYDSMMVHLGVQGEWEKKLLQSLFKEEIFFDRFDFIKREETDTLRIDVKGGRSVFFENQTQESFIPIERPVQLQVTETNVFGDHQYQLDCEKLKKRANSEFALIALFNCQAFKSVEMRNTKYSDAIRKVEFLDTSKLSKLDLWCQALGPHLRSLKMP